MSHSAPPARPDSPTPAAGPVGGGERASSRRTVIDLRGASFGYAGTPVVSDLDLTLRQGESLALLGANGCGKSTLVRGLLGLNERLGGHVEILGERPDRLTRRGRIGYVPQRHTLSTSVVATVGEIVAIGRLPRLPLVGRFRARDRQIVAEALDLVGLGGMQRRDVTHLSGGQQRRVLVARALASQPELLIMDEPTAGVDEEHQRVIAAAMRRLAADGVAILTVTHELDALADAVDRAVVMEAGRIVFDGPPQAVSSSAPGALHHCDHHEDDEALEPHEIPRAGVPLRDLHLPIGDA